MMPDYSTDPLDISRFSNFRPFAVGTYGQVFLAKDQVQNGKEVVIKKISKQGDNSRVKNEILAFERMPAFKRGLVQFHGFFESQNHLYLVFDRIKGGDLFNLMEYNGFRPLAEPLVRNIMRSVVKSLSHCHSNGIAHRDIKLENIIIEQHSGMAVLIDFGLCSFFETFNGAETASSDFCGSLEYIPPEVFDQIPFAASKADSWSMGVTFFALVFGRFPFTIADNLDEGMENPYGEIRSSSVILPENNPSEGLHVSQELRSVLSGLLKFNPSERSSVTSLSSHPFFSKTAKIQATPSLPQEFLVDSSMIDSSMLIEV